MGTEEQLSLDLQEEARRVGHGPRASFAELERRAVRADRRRGLWVTAGAAAAVAVVAVGLQVVPLGNDSGDRVVARTATTYSVPELREAAHRLYLAATEEGTVPATVAPRQDRTGLMATIPASELGARTLADVEQLYIELAGVAVTLTEGERYQKRHERLATSDFPTNEHGLTFGSSSIDVEGPLRPEDLPELIGVVGKNGTDGFTLRATEFDADPDNPVTSVPVYASDGITQVDVMIRQGTGASLTLQEARAYLEDGTVPDDWPNDMRTETLRLMAKALVEHTEARIEKRRQSK